jgi:hypothetical protein
MKGAIAIPHNEKRPVPNQAFHKFYENFNNHRIVPFASLRVS